MARPLSKEKRSIILDAAAVSIATDGIGASTAKIASTAGFSEGTIFTYFPNKDDLLNQVYLEIKADIARIMFDAYPTNASLHDRLLHVWDGLIEWGHKNQVKGKAMAQLAVSDRITQENREAGEALFQEIDELLKESVVKGTLQGRSVAFGSALFQSVAGTTIENMQQEPLEGDAYRQAGFDFFWKGLGL